MIAISSSSVEHWEKLLENSKSRRDLEAHTGNSEAHTGNSEAHIQKSIEKWEKHKKMVLSRFENMNLIAGLVLTTSAAFISTTPTQPPIPGAIHRTFICEVVSFAAALISLMTGVSVLIIYDACYAHEAILESFTKSRSRLVWCLILMAVPSLALVVSTLALTIAMCNASFSYEKSFGTVLIGVTCGIFFLLILLAIYVFEAPLRLAARGDDPLSNASPASLERGPSY
jgi:hypothetical protein